MSRKKSLNALGAVATVALLAVAGCSSSGGGSSASTTPAGNSSPVANSGSSTGGTGNGSDVTAKLMIEGDFTSTIPFTLPEIVPMVKGVLKGFPNVTLETCDAKGTAPGFLACEQKAISDKVAGVVAGFSSGGQDMSLLTKAKIPIIGVGDAHSPNMYPPSESFSLYVALGAGLYKAGCKKLGIIYLDGSDFLVDYIKTGFEGSGGKEVARAAVPATAADLSPAVSKVVGAGAECVAVSLVPTLAASALTALKQSGKSLLIGGIAAVFSDQVIAALGPLTDGLLVVDAQQNAADVTPGLTAAADAMHSEDPKAQLTEQAIEAYISAKLVAAALPAVSGDVTAASLTTALDGLKNVDMGGVIPPWTSTPLDSKTFPRIFNHYGITYKITNGKPVRQGDFYDTSSLLVGK